MIDGPHLGIRELRAGLATHVRRASAGDRLVVTVDGRPAAQLSPITPVGSPCLTDLVAAGLVRSPLRDDHPSAPADLPLLPVDLLVDDVLADLRGDLPRRSR